MHPLCEIMQIVTIDGLHYIHWQEQLEEKCHRSCGNHLSLVVWVLVFQERVMSPQVTDQVKILQLWDEINLSYAKKKQVTGPAIPILGFEVDSNRMSAYLSLEKCQQLVDCVNEFMHGMSKALQGWLHVAGQLSELGIEHFPMVESSTWSSVCQDWR